MVWMMRPGGCFYQLFIKAPGGGFVTGVQAREEGAMGPHAALAGPQLTPPARCRLRPQRPPARGLPRRRR